MRGIGIAIIGLVAVLAMPAAHAQVNFPSRVVKLVVPYPPGGGTDLLARVLADRLVAQMGPVGDHRECRRRRRQYRRRRSLSRRSGRLHAASCLARARSRSMTSSFKDMPYDPTKWVPIAVLATSPYVLVLSPAFPASSVQDVIARARAKPGRLIAATPGLGSVGHFATIELEMLAHIDLLQVPYKGLGPAVSRRRRRPRQYDVRHAGDLAAAAPGRHRRRSSPSAAPNASRRCPMCRLSPKPACRAFAPSPFSASWRRRERRTPGRQDQPRC